MIRSPTPVTAPDVAIGAAMKQPRETASTHPPRYAWSGSPGVDAVVTALALAASRPSVSAPSGVDRSVGDAQLARLWRDSGLWASATASSAFVTPQEWHVALVEPGSVRRFARHCLRLRCRIMRRSQCDEHDRDRLAESNRPARPGNPHRARHQPHPRSAGSAYATSKRAHRGLPTSAARRQRRDPRRRYHRSLGRQPTRRAARPSAARAAGPKRRMTRCRVLWNGARRDPTRLHRQPNRPTPRRFAPTTPGRPSSSCEPTARTSTGITWPP